MRLILYIFLLILLILGVTFAYLNATPVMFNYYVGQISVPLSLLLVLTLGVGIFLGLVSLLVPILKLKTKNSTLKRKLKNAQKEVENLRNIPLQD